MEVRTQSQIALLLLQKQALDCFTPMDICFVGDRELVECNLQPTLIVLTSVVDSGDRMKIIRIHK